MSTLAPKDHYHINMGYIVKRASEDGSYVNLAESPSRSAAFIDGVSRLQEMKKKLGLGLTPQGSNMNPQSCPASSSSPAHTMKQMAPSPQLVFTLTESSHLCQVIAPAPCSLANNPFITGYQPSNSEPPVGNPIAKAPRSDSLRALLKPKQPAHSY